MGLFSQLVYPLFISAPIRLFFRTRLSLFPEGSVFCQVIFSLFHICCHGMSRGPSFSALRSNCWGAWDLKACSGSPRNHLFCPSFIIWTLLFFSGFYREIRPCQVDRSSRLNDREREVAREQLHRFHSGEGSIGFLHFPCQMFNISLRYHFSFFQVSSKS